MLYRLQRRWQVRAIISAIALYTLCFAAPTVSLAFGGVAAAHCLVPGHEDMASLHGEGALPLHTPDRFQAPADDHDHHDRSGGHAGSCCGLFCVGTIPDIGTQALDEPHLSEPLAARISARLFSHSPENLYRPPISFS